MYPQTSLKPSYIPTVISWIVSISSIIIGIAVAIVGKASSVDAQVGATNKTLTDAETVYNMLAKGETLTSVGAALIAAGVIGLIITICHHSQVAVAQAYFVAANTPEIDPEDFYDDDEDAGPVAETPSQPQS